MSDARRSQLSTVFVTVRQWADVPLDMNAPQLAFTMSGEPEDGDWLDTDWVGNTSLQSDPSLPKFGLNYRLHRILVGPGAQAAIALTPGRWLIWRQLTDTPEIPTDIVAGTITIF